MTSFKKLTLIAPILLEEEVVDALLEMDPELAFIAGRVYAHAADGEGLSLLEQVTGRKGKIRFEIVGSDTAIEALLGGLRIHFGGAGIHFWLQSLEAGGVI
jgi:hypothetical protein